MALSARARRAGLSRAATVAVLSLAAVSWVLSVGRMQGMDAGPGWRSPARVIAAAVLLVLAVGVSVAPGSVPGLIVPGSPAAERAMTRISGMRMEGKMPAGGARHRMSMPR